MYIDSSVKIVLMAYAGSSAFFSKMHYIIIGLSPVIILGVLLAILNVIVPTEWFWFVYVLQVSNISGAAGDFYTTYITIKMPDDILVHDCGVSMILYSKQKAI